MSGIIDMTIGLVGGLISLPFRAIGAAGRGIAHLHQQARDNALNASRERANTLQRQLDNENAVFKSEIAGLSQMVINQNNRFREQANKYNRLLETQKEETDKKFKQQEIEQNEKLQELKNNTDKKFKQQEVKIEEIKKQQEKDKQELQGQINNICAYIDKKESDKRKRAEEWFKQADIYIKSIEKYRHDLFKPGILDKLKSRLKQMSSDITNGDYDAAISTARDIFNDAVELKEDVLNAETEWLYYHGLFIQALANTENNLEYCNELEFQFDMEHGTEKVPAEINYWTNGVLDEVTESINELKRKKEKIDNVPTEELKDFIENLNKQNIKMEESAEKAKNILVLSQYRAQIANDLADAMEGQSWTCDDIIYEGGEQDQPVHVKLSDGMGNEILAIISPDTETMTNKMEMHFFDNIKDMKERRARIEDIEKCLQQEGLPVGKAKCTAGPEASEKKELKDIKQTKERKIERKSLAKKEV